MTAAILALAMSVFAADSPGADNPIFLELVEKGVEMSDGGRIKLPRPFMPDGLDAAGQRKALESIASARYPADRIVQKSFYAPAPARVRTLKRPDGEGPAVRAIDLCFVAHGNWDILTSKDFLDSLSGADDEEAGGIASKSGELNDEEMNERKLSIVKKDGYEERFIYTTFTLFERVELSTTRLAGLSRGPDSWLAASRIDGRFDKDPKYPNQWRPLLRDARAEIKPGKPRPFTHAGGYAKITRLKEPADAVFVECHLAYEEDYGWFDGANLVRQKAPLIVREKARTFRRKLAVASKKETDKQN